MISKTALILGGGVGGLVAANRLRRLLPGNHRVILVDRETHHTFQPSLLWVVTGERRAEQIQRPLDSLRRKGIEVIRGAIESLDPTARSVRVGGSEIAADAIVVSLGAELAPEAIPGLAEAGHNLYSVAGAESLREALARIRSGRIVVLTAAPAYKCPAAPYEAAMLIEDRLRRLGVRDTVKLDLFAAEPGPMGVAGPEVSGAVRGMVESKGIGYFPEHQVSVVDPAAGSFTFATGRTESYDLLAYVPPHRPPAVVRTAGLLAESGWVKADRFTFETGFPGVYAIGDVVGVPLAMGKPLPKAGVFAHAQAEVVAANLAAAWNGKAGRASFDGHGKCWVEAGDGRAGWGVGDFYAEPLPQVALRQPSRWGHWGKQFFEWNWLRSWL